MGVHELLAQHLDPGEGSLGVHVDVSHLAATPPGMTVTVDAECIEVVGPRVAFKVKAHDGIDLIGEGRHERFVVAWDKFNARVAAKAAKVTAGCMMAEAAPNAISPSTSGRNIRRRTACCGSCLSLTAKWSSGSIRISGFCTAAPRS